MNNKISNYPDQILKKLQKGVLKNDLMETLININDIFWLCSKVTTILKSQPVFLELDSPIIIVGDIHGQYNYLLKIFELGGEISKNKYLFLGDYVGRGPNSIEVLCLLFCMKIKFPNQIFFLRGNHETTDISKIDGFFDETTKKRMKDSWYCFNEVFRWFPITALIGKRVFCVHGGLSPELKEIEQLMDFKRPLDIPSEGLLADITWSDPHLETGWVPNIDREMSFCYGSDVVNDFLQNHNFDLLCRAHQVVPNGFEFPFGIEGKCLTIFSSPYDNNKGAILIIDSNLQCSIRTFN